MNSLLSRAPPPQLHFRPGKWGSNLNQQRSNKGCFELQMEPLTSFAYSFGIDRSVFIVYAD